MPLSRCRLATLAILLLAPAACASRAPERTLSFACDGGKGFLVHYSKDRAFVTTEAGIWQLRARPSSIGRKFASDTATLIHDEERAALNGLPGGPFRRCREAISDLTGREGGEALL